MNERWWAPQRGTLTPDTVVATMLTQPEDLASTLLAVHRAGAAACELVASRPIPSEVGLVNAMAAARANFAPGAMSAIAKSMEPNYAGLLVRDVLSDAELGALSVYRSAVAKGVSPPAAASRAGAVYGVPAREMGRYAVLATDPKANPVALTDAADRALLGYVAKLARIEDPGEVVEVSKAPARHPHSSERWEEREHPRDPTTGQFVEAPPTEGPPVMEGNVEPPRGTMAWLRRTLGLGEASAPGRVAEVDTRAPTAPAPAPARTRQQRQQRQQRQTRATRQLRPTGVQQSVSQSAKVRPVSRATERRILGRVNQGSVRAQPKGKDLVPAKPSVTPDLLNTLGTHRPDQYYELFEPVTLVADRDVMDALVAKMSAQSAVQHDRSKRLLRIHHLMATSASLPEDSSHTGAVNHLLEASAENTEAADQTLAVDHIHPEEQRFATPREITELLEARRRAAVTRQVGDRTVVDEDELSHVVVMPEYQPYGRSDDELRGHAVVHFQQTEGSEEFWDRPEPTIDEIVVEAPVGREEGATRHRQIVLDPNGAYELVKPQGGDGFYEEFWHSELGVIVRRWHLRYLDDAQVDDIMGGPEVGKALEPAERVAFEQLHPRDAEGRFAEVEESVEAPVSRPVVRQQQRQARQVRQRRAVRQLRQEAAPTPGIRAVQRVTQRATARATAKSGVRVVLAQRAAERARRGELEELPELADWQDYKLMPELTLDKWLEDNFGEGEVEALHAGAELTLHGVARRGLAEASNYRAGQLAAQMAYNVQDDVGRTSSIPTKLLGHMRVSGLTDDQELGEKIDALFDANPDLDIIEIVPTGDGRVLHFHGNTNPANAQSLVEIDPDTDWDKPVYLTYVGHYRARDITTVSLNGARESLADITNVLGEAKGGEGAVPNPELHIYRVTSAKVRRYRASND